jgi:hypothetical protein
MNLALPLRNSGQYDTAQRMTLSYTVLDEDLEPVSADRSIVRFRAPNGSQWKVFEMRDAVPNNGASLIFSSDEGFRRVRRFPSNWDQLDPSSLWELSWRR